MCKTGSTSALNLRAETDFDDWESEQDDDNDEEDESMNLAQKLQMTKSTNWNKKN